MKYLSFAALVLAANVSYAENWGSYTSAPGVNATAWGNSTSATGANATAWGNRTSAAGYNATAWGNRTAATGSDATAWGRNSAANGVFSTAWGRSAAASGAQSTAWGEATSALGLNSTAWGNGASAAGNVSTAFGLLTSASGYGSVAAGHGTVAEAPYAFATGTFNLESPETDGLVEKESDVIFSVGNGTSDISRSTAFSVRRDGVVVVKGDLIVGGSVSAASDAALKSNIYSFNNGEDVVMALNPVYYTLNSDDSVKQQVGLVAQDVEAVIPELVMETPAGHKAVDYSRLSAVLVDAVQSLKAENEMLKEAVCEINPNSDLCS